jgi:predicted RNA binding protein YcfA (HicA-like mRNA interferase family)
MKRVGLKGFTTPLPHGHGSEFSYRHFKHPEQPSVITVPGNEGKELAPDTLNDRLKKAGLE